MKCDKDESGESEMLGFGFAWPTIATREKAEPTRSSLCKGWACRYLPRYLGSSKCKCTEIASCIIGISPSYVSTRGVDSVSSDYMLEMLHICKQSPPAEDRIRWDETRRRRDARAERCTCTALAWLHPRNPHS